MADETINDEDREYFGTDSKKFFERALLKSKTWEEGVRYAKELRTLQHPTLSSVQSKVDTVTAIELRWSSPSEIRSNELPEQTTITIEQTVPTNAKD